MEKENKLTNGMKHLIVMIGIAVLLMFTGILKVEAAESDLYIIHQNDSYIKSDECSNKYDLPVGTHYDTKTTHVVIDTENYEPSNFCLVLTDSYMDSNPSARRLIIYRYDLNGGLVKKEVGQLFKYRKEQIVYHYKEDGDYFNEKYNTTEFISICGLSGIHKPTEGTNGREYIVNLDTNLPIFASVEDAKAYYVDGDDSGNINKPEETDKYDSTLPNIQNLVYKSISPKECHGKNTTDCVTCFNLSWKVPVDKTESDIYQVKMYVKYSYTTTDSNSLQYKTEMIDISNCSGTFLVGEGTQDICAQDIKENLNINNLSTFDIHTIYKIYVRTMRTTSDHVSHYGNWTEFTMNKGILNNTSVGESVEVPGDTDINDDGTIDRELKGVIYLNDFYLKNVSVGKMDILGRRNISWTSTTRDADVLLVPDSDTIVVASFMVVNNDEESSTTQNEYKTVTIGSCGFQFLIEDIFEITDNQDCKWDGKLRLCPMYYSNGYLYVGELTVIDVLNDKVTNEGLDDEGNLKQEDVTPDATIDNNTIVNYTNTFLSYLKTLVSQIGELPSLFAVVFAFIPGIYLNVIGIIFIIILILRVLGR